MRQKAIFFWTALACSTQVALGAADSDRLREQSDRQQQIRNQTAAVSDQIDSIVSEFDRNGLGGGKEVDTLKSIRNVLGQLDQDQMQRVIALLQQAAGNPNATDDARQAYLVQQDIVGQFRKLLIDYQRQQGLAALADRIEKLANRQAANLRSAVDLATANAAKSQGVVDSNSAAALQAQQAEQREIAADSADAVAAAHAMLNDATGDEALRLRKAVADPNTAAALTNSKSAAADLQGGNLFRAAGGEKTARDALHALADELASPKDALTIKKEQLAVLDAISQQQQDLLDQTTAPNDHHTPEQQLLRPIARDQARSVDETDNAKRKLSNISPQAAAALDHAEQHMQEARGDLNGQNRQAAAEEQLKAKVDVNEARRQLQDEIAKAEQQPSTRPSQDALASARQLVEQIKSIRKQQQNATADTSSRQIAPQQKSQQQQSLVAGTQNLQQQAAESSPQAADSLGQAAQQMQQAAAALGKSNLPAAAAKQQSADSALATAQSAAEQQVKDLQQTQQQLSDLEKTQQQIADLIKKQAEIATTQPSPADPQQQLAKQTAQAQSTLPAAAKAASDPLGHASDEMKAAAAQLQKNNPADARPAQVQAIASLAEAAAKVNGAMDQLKSQLGQSPDDAAAQKAAESAIDQASKQLQQAQAALDQPGASDQAQAKLEAAAQDVAQAMAKGGDDQSSEQLQKAIGDIAKAADANQQNQNGQAKQNAAKAADALAQAKMSLPNSAPAMAAASQNPPGSESKPDPNAVKSDPNTAGLRTAQDGGPRDDQNGSNSFVQLPPRDRAALEQSQGEKYPQEYGPLVEQYLRNLSDASQK